MSLPTAKQSKFSRLVTLAIQSIKGVEHDYTQGSIRKAIVLLAIPMMAELILESVFAVVDLFFVSHLPNSKNAITTVGLTESSISIIFSLAMGLSIGATAVVARRIGEKDHEGAAHAGAQAILIAIGISIVIGIAGLIFAEDVLRIMGADATVVKEGAIFTRIMLGSSMVIILLFLINGVFRGAGDAAMAMRSLLLSSALNIILCPILIYVAGLGLKGAAIATVIGRGTGVLYQCYYLFKGKGILKMRRSHFSLDAPIIRNLMNVSWPATFQFFIQSGSWIVLAMIVAHTGGADASAGYQVAIRNVVFFILPAWGLSNAAAALVGQNLGAGRPDRAEKSVLLTTKYNAVFMGFLSLAFLILPEAIVNIFTKDPGVQHYATLALRILGSGYVFYGIGMVMIQALNGAGDTRTPTLINLFCFWCFQIPFALLLSYGFKMGPVGAFWCVPVAETIIALISFYYFRKGKWKTVKV